MELMRDIDMTLKKNDGRNSCYSRYSRDQKKSNSKKDKKKKDKKSKKKKDKERKKKLRRELEKSQQQEIDVVKTVDDPNVKDEYFDIKSEHCLIPLLP